jgi:glutaconate CoA-transferase subunit B
MSKLTDIQSLAAAVPSGATIAVGGFQLSRVPVALLQAIAAGGTRRVHTVSAPNPFALEILAASGVLATADCGFIGFQYEDGFVIPPALRRGLATATIVLQQRDVYDTIRALRAAAESAEPIADFALLHAQRADAEGNLAMDDPYADVQLAGGSASVLATAETLVERIAQPTIGAARVGGVALVERGASPTACFGHYPRDVAGIRAQLGDAVTPVAVAGAPAPDGADAFIVNMARQVRDGEVIVTGLASATASLAIELARATHAPAARYINCVGAVNVRPAGAVVTSVEPELLYHCDETIDLPQIFDLARDGGVDAMFFGAAQIDVQGNINLTRIGPAAHPKVRFAGPAGSSSMRSYVRRVLVSVPRQSPRNLVERVDTTTSAPGERNEETVLVTDMAVWRLQEGNFIPHSRAPGIDIERLSSDTGFSIAGADPAPTPPPTEVELGALRHLDPAGIRYRLLPARPSFRSTSKSSEKVTQ